MGKKAKVGVGGNIPIAIFLIFLTLKLAGVGQVADWSWWWVTAPLWGIPVVIAAILLLVAVGWLVNELLKDWQYRRRKRRQ